MRLLPLILLPLILLVVCCAASAKWEYMRTSQDGELEFFIDPDTVKPIGNMILVWVLINIKKGEPSSARSIVSFIEHDCLETRYKVLDSSSFSGSMGGGKVIRSGDMFGEWKFILPNTMGASTHRWLCAK